MLDAAVGWAPRRQIFEKLVSLKARPERSPGWSPHRDFDPPPHLPRPRGAVVCASDGSESTPPGSDQLPRRPWCVPDFAPELSCVLPVQAALRERDPITPSTPPSVAMRRQTPMRPHAEPSPRSTARVKCDDWNGFSRRSLIVVVRRGGVRSELKEPVAFGTHQLFGVKRTTKAVPP